MAHSPEYNPVSPEAINDGYEPQRISIRGLLIFLVLFVAGMVAIEVLLVWLMHDIERHDDRLDVPRSALTIDQTPPPPQLQPSIGHDTFDYEDLEKERQEEDDLFAKLGWTVNPATHEVTIPPDIVKAVADGERSRAAAAYVPPTTTGKDTNSSVPGAVPRYDTQGGINGGQRP